MGGGAILGSSDSVGVEQAEAAVYLHSSDRRCGCVGYMTPFPSSAGIWLFCVLSSPSHVALVSSVAHRPWCTRVITEITIPTLNFLHVLFKCGHCVLNSKLQIWSHLGGLDLLPPFTQLLRLCCWSLTACFMLPCRAVVLCWRYGQFSITGLFTWFSFLFCLLPACIASLLHQELLSGSWGSALGIQNESGWTGALPCQSWDSDKQSSSYVFRLVLSSAVLV